MTAVMTSMISYADNREDVLLARALREVREGFYIDVGANHPTGSSVTRHFYNAGWSGLNIEPLQSLSGLYARQRPRDTTLNLALSSQAGQLDFWEGLGNAVGLSTLSEEQVERHRLAGFEFAKGRVPVTTLAAVCEEHVRDRTIDFLSIDVEGHEREVLLGADLERFRPRIILLEATRPNSQESVHDNWEDLLLAADYSFGAFDGLNRFYVRAEDQAELLPRLAVPANVFDDYISYETHLLREQVREMSPIIDRAIAQGAIGDGALAVARRIDSFYNRYRFLSSAAARLLAWRK